MTNHDDRPQILITISGGVADVFADPNIHWEIIDYDDNPDAKIPDDFIALVERELKG